MSACPHCGQEQPQLTLAGPPAEHKARSSDPDTSKAAAKLAFPGAGSQRFRVLAALSLIEHRDGGAGATAEHLSIVADIPYVSVSTRISELLAGGWIYRTGRTAKTTTGSAADLVAMTGRGRESLQDHYRRAEVA